MLLLFSLPLALADARLRLNPVEFAASLQDGSAVHFDVLGTTLPQAGWSFSFWVGDRPVDRCQAVVKTPDPVAADKTYTGELTLRGCTELLAGRLLAAPGAAIRLVPAGSAWSELQIDLTTPESAGELPIASDSGGWVLSPPIGTRAMAFYEAGAWVYARPDSTGAIRINAENIAHLQPVGARGKVWAYVWPAVGAPQSRELTVPVFAATPRPTPAPTSEVPGPSAAARCPKPRDPDAVLITVDLRSASASALTVRPGQPLEVCVLHRADWRVEVTLGGTRGFVDPVVRSLAEAQSGSDDAPITTWASFAPRAPGAADLTIVARDPTAAVTARLVVELVVEPTYAGAVRLGLGLAWAPYQRDYEVVTVPGSGQAEITNLADPGGSGSVELVVGYAVFLERGGRGYHSAPSGPARLSRHLAPYLGIGLIDGDTTAAFDLLKTVYVGGEWEFNPSASLALTGLLRRTELLAPGLQVGGPAADPTTTALTTQTWRPGVGVVLNVSPELFRTVAKGVSP